MLVAAGSLFAWYGQWEAARWYLTAAPAWVQEALGAYEYPLFLGVLALAGSLITLAVIQGGTTLWRWGKARYAAAPTARFVAIIAMVCGALTLVSLLAVFLALP